MSQYSPKPIDQAPVGSVLDLNDEDRIAYMKSLGARNVDPPLPRSSHLRNKVNGRVLPWDHLLAEQRDIMECCDANGNTDPDAWKPTVVETEYDPEEQKLLMANAQDRIFTQAEKLTSGFRVPDAVNTAPRPTAYENGAVPFDQVSSVLPGDLDKLIASV